MFIEPDAKQVEASKKVGAPVVELVRALIAMRSRPMTRQKRRPELARLQKAAFEASKLGLEVHAGHGISYKNVGAIAAIPELVELNIGHFLIGEAVFVGLETSVRQMRALMNQAREPRIMTTWADYRHLGHRHHRHPPHRARAPVTVCVFKSACSPRKNAPMRSTARALMPQLWQNALPAKEACAKALGTGLGQGVSWQDIGVVRQKFGPPSLEIKGKAAEHLARLTPKGLAPKIHISLTDDHPQALAFVVISAVVVMRLPLSRRPAIPE